MPRDQELVKQLQRHLRNWNSDTVCPFDNEQCCQYDEQGRLIRLHFCGEVNP